MAEVQTVKRVITYKGNDLADLNPEASIDDVVKMHAATIPELATAAIEGPIMEDGYARYRISERLGTKG